MASGSSSSGDGNSDENISLDQLMNSAFVTQALPTTLSLLELGGFDGSNAQAVYHLLRLFHGYMLDSKESVRSSRENVIRIAGKAAENDAALNSCAQLMNLAASPEVLQNFTPDQQKNIMEFQKNAATPAGVNPTSSNQKPKQKDPKDAEIARLKSTIASLSGDLKHQKEIYEQLLIRYEELEKQFRDYRAENDRMS